ncbi:hypothetical protein L7F22_000837 [Adiantum nelumboides]|nr:hypothetical protein [Adiantum nelumboides]
MGPSDDFSKDMRRRLRKKLKEDLIKVQNLSSKLEARSMQLLQSGSEPVHPSFSDAQFSGNDFAIKGGAGKEVTSQLNLAAKGSLYPVAPLSEQQFLEAGNGSITRAELQGSKRTPKVSQVYKKSEFLIGKDKRASPVKPNQKLSKSNGQATRILERKSSELPNDLKTLCRNILKKLMDHEDGWIFNEPVDSIKLGLSDYHFVIKKPMDLGTIKGRVDKRHYKSLSEFADDVKLTFKNAMSYNPPGNDVHQSARMLLTMFERDWDALRERLSKANGHGQFDVLTNSSCEGPQVTTLANSEANLLTNRTASLTKKPLHSQSGSRRIPPGKAKALVTKSQTLVRPDTKRKFKDNLNFEAPYKPGTPTKSPIANTKPSSTAKTLTKFEAPAKAKAPVRPIKSAEKAKKRAKANTQTKAKANVQKKAMNYEEKVRLQTLLGQLPQHKLEELIYLMRERIINISQDSDEIEVDLDSFDDDTLWELQQRASDCLKSLPKSPASRKRPREDNFAGKAGKRPKGPFAVALEQNVSPGKRSSSVSRSSTESDSLNSSTSDSDG